MKRYTAPPMEWSCGVLLSLIKKSGVTFEEEFELSMDGSIEYWGQSYEFSSPITAAFSAGYAGERILANIAVYSKISLSCSRCLTKTELAIGGNLRYLFSLRPIHSEAVSNARGNVESHDDIDEDGDVDVIPIDSFQAEFDISPYIWEVLLLSLPERVLCSDSCGGLCPICGKNLNEGDCGCESDSADPRLEVLRDYSIKEQGREE
ncbi:MAG: DUF177 domain-containing protein [Synergistaceae bacterium]|jgi:uncharacterized protein|nr:DUF177 domain-containing protein [Synergistaceae bacterium]